MPPYRRPPTSAIRRLRSPLAAKSQYVEYLAHCRIFSERTSRTVGRRAKQANGPMGDVIAHTLKLEPIDQRGEASDHHIGWNVPRLRDAIKNVKNSFGNPTNGGAFQLEILQTWGRSTQERVGNDRRVVCPNPQMRYLRKWLPRASLP